MRVAKSCPTVDGCWWATHCPLQSVGIAASSDVYAQLKLRVDMLIFSPCRSVARPVLQTCRRYVQGGTTDGPSTRQQYNVCNGIHIGKGVRASTNASLTQHAFDLEALPVWVQSATERFLQPMETWWGTWKA